MSALAVVAQRAPTARGVEAEGAPSAGREVRQLMARFDAAGQIHWMNGAARDVWGPAGTVGEALVSAKALPALACFPLGDQWLWLGLMNEARAWLAERVRQINLLLADVLRQRSAGNLALLRAQGRFQEHCYRAAQARALRHASAEFITALEAERGRIARELHDNAGQSLAGILLNLELLERRLRSAGAEVEARLARSRELASLTLDQIRRISHELHPPEWNEMDFAAAAEWLVETMGVGGKLRVEMDAQQAPRNLSPEVKTTLYRSLQEGLTNILRHSGASRVTIRARADGGGVGLVLEDDGQGFDPAALPTARNGIGLRNIRRRVESLGGRLEIKSAPGRGVRLSVFVPTREGAG